MKQYFIYIVTNKKNGVLYTGVTNDLVRRIYEHRNSMVEGFTKKYSLKFLVYYEMFQDIDRAIEIIRTTELDKMVIPNLKEYFLIDDNQAEYIAEIKLRNINKEYLLNKTNEMESVKKEI